MTAPTRLAMTALLLALAAVAWAVTGDRMSGMDAGPGTDLGALGRFLAIWVVMMAAMMLPSAAPAVLDYAGARGRDRAGRPLPAIPASAAFVAGYLGGWTVAGVAGYAIVEGVRALDPGFLAWSQAGRYVAAAVVLGAAAYQLTTVKDHCLECCRSPLASLDPGAASGAAGGLWRGVEYGGYCLGCCWALMAALFALGIMSLAWMAVVAALIAAEKLLPWRALASRAIAVALAALAIAIAFAPDQVPGLTIPGSAEAMEAMEAMGMGSETGGGSMGSGADAMG